MDADLLLIALVTAVFTSLEANYFGKPFGTAPDYLAIILLSGGIDAATVTGLTTIIGRFFDRQ